MPGDEKRGKSLRDLMEERFAGQPEHSNEKKEPILRTFKVPHGIHGDCPNNGKDLEITVDVGTFASLNMQKEARCPLCDKALL
jgi:hypothetical protein